MEANESFPVVKARRTKRPRPSLPFSHASTSSIGGISSGEGEDGRIHGHHNDGSSSSDVMDAINHVNNTAEEEDTANCLILLAQGYSKHKEQRKEKIVETREELYPYECKTCNRSFHSFQALGGHRASHKKPKASICEEKKGLAEGQLNDNNMNSDQAPAFPAEGNSNKAKVHECSICGSEFSSGQALGGHMRRHRNIIASVAAMNMEYRDDQKSENVFRFDLNLPAPEEDVLASKPLIFSSPALVDCYY